MTDSIITNNNNDVQQNDHQKNINTNTEIRYPQFLVNNDVCGQISTLSQAALNATLLVCFLKCKAK